MPKPFTILNWGGGLHSTTLAVMASLGDLPPVDLVIFADPGAERVATYKMIDFYSQWLTERGVEIAIIHTGDIMTEGAKEHIHIPFWTEEGSPLQRQCTRDFKIRPIKREIRKRLGYHPSRPPAPPAGSIHQQIGFAFDEIERMFTSPVRYIVNRFPLIDLRMTTNDCLDYLAAKNLPVPPSSACLCCPYRSASEWLKIKSDAPQEFEAACQFDEKNRHNPMLAHLNTSALYIYKKATPLREANLVADAKQERPGKQLNLFCTDACYT